jgi:hypothetical protein
MGLATYYTPGRSGLRVSRLALGAMTFGYEHVGRDAASSRALIDLYVASGDAGEEDARVLLRLSHPRRMEESQ